MNNTVKQLIELAGPLGPFGTGVHTDSLLRVLKAGKPLEAAERILYAVGTNPTLPPNILKRDFEFAVSEVLSELSEQDSVRRRLENGLWDVNLRLVVIDALAMLANSASGAALAALASTELSDSFLKEDELIRLASALGSVGGSEARVAVEALLAHPFSEAVLRELEIAREAIGDQDNYGSKV